MRLIDDATNSRTARGISPEIIIGFSLEDCEYLADEMGARINSAEASRRKPDGFDVDFAEMLNHVVQSHKTAKRREELDRQIAELERERDAI